jgi:acyl-CoA synthetase (NDP forming)
MTDFNKFFTPSSVVLLGASSDQRKWGWRILGNILAGGFQGNIYPINPKRDEILGKKVYKSVAEVPEVPDLAIIVVPPIGIVTAVQDCVDKGIKAGVVITAGFAEIGAKGVALQKEMLEAARKGGIRLIGPNCFGILNPSHKLYAQMPPVYPPAGSIAVVSQSGNVGATIARRAMALDLGISRLISTGNEADLHVEDFFEYLGEDDLTKVILSYVEGFKDGRAFIKIASQVSRHKPIIMIKVGETEAGASAARSHTAALSGSNRVFEGACRQAGIIRVTNIREMTNIGYGFLCNPVPRGSRVGIATIGGGWGVLAADACAKLGLDVVKLNGEVLKELDSFLPGWWSRNNPVDLVAGSGVADEILRVIEVLAKYDQTDGVICLGLPFPSLGRPPSPMTDEERQRRRGLIIDHYKSVFTRIRGLSEKYGKPVIVSAELFVPRQYIQEQDIHSAISEVGGICYNQPHEAAVVMRALSTYGEFLRR